MGKRPTGYAMLDIDENIYPLLSIPQATWGTQTLRLNVVQSQAASSLSGQMVESKICRCLRSMDQEACKTPLEHLKGVFGGGR